MLSFKEYLAIEEATDNLFEIEREGIQVRSSGQPPELMQKPAFQSGVLEKAADIIINPISDSLYQTGQVYKDLFNKALRLVFKGIGEVSKPLVNPVVAAINGALKIIFDPIHRIAQTQANFAYSTGGDEMRRIETELQSRFPDNPQLQQAVMKSISSNLRQIQSQLQQAQGSTSKAPLQNLKSTIVQHLKATWNVFASEIKNYPMAIAKAFINSFKSEDFHAKRIPQEFQSQIEVLANQIREPMKKQQFLQSMIELANKIVHEIPSS